MFEFATKFIVDPDKWLIDVWAQITAANLPEIVRGLAIIFLVLGVVWNGLRIASLGASTEMQGFVVRVLVASALVFSGLQIGNEVRSLWSMGYQWGSANFTEKTTNQANDELTNLRNTMMGLSAGILAAPIIIEGGKALLGKDRGDAMKDAKEGVINNGKIILELVKYVVGGLAAIITSEYIVVIVTGFAVMLASILIPFSGVMILFPSPAMGMWFSMWFRATSGAILIVMLSPIAFSAAMTLGFIEPAKNYNVALTKSAEQFKGATDILGSLKPGNADPRNFLSYIQSSSNKLEAAAKQVGNSLGTLSFGLVSSIIMLFVGIAFAVMLIFAAQSQIIAFVGGMAGGGGGANLAPLAAAAGFAGAGLAATAGGLTGGGGSSSGSAQSSGSPSRPESQPGGEKGGGTNSPGGSGGGSPRFDEHGTPTDPTDDAAWSQWSQGEHQADLANFDAKLAESPGMGQGGAGMGQGGAGGTGPGATSSSGASPSGVTSSNSGGASKPGGSGGGNSSPGGSGAGASQAAGEAAEGMTAAEVAEDVAMVALI